MTATCGSNHNFDGADPAFRRVLMVVIAINAAMFVIEAVAGHVAQSKALQADALDFFADAVTYIISFIVIGMPQRTRTLAAIGKGSSLLLMGLWVLGSAVYSMFILKLPQAGTMGLVGLMAFLANVTSVLLLMKWRKGDANVRSVWLCSRNDALSNIAVILAAFGVFGTGTAWPDLIVACIMAFLFLSSAVHILMQSLKELSATNLATPSSSKDKHCDDCTH